MAIRFSLEGYKTSAARLALSACLFSACEGAPAPKTQSSSAACTIPQTRALLKNEPLAHPGMGILGASGMHGDSASSDTMPFPGPGAGRLKAQFRHLGAVCPTVLVRRDQRLWLLCTKFIGRHPVAMLMDPESMLVLASKSLDKGALLGGVYAYLDQKDQLVMVDGKQNMLWLKAKRAGIAKLRWEIAPSQTLALGPSISKACGSSNCDQVVSISPGREDSVWWVTREGLVGIADRESGKSRVSRLDAGEQVHNSFSTTPSGQAAILSDHALYLFRESEQKAPLRSWKRSYDRGSARKPGQLSWGSGATPTFFGAQDPNQWITITDNADEQLSVLVYRHDGKLVCKHPVFGPAQAGSENSLAAVGREIYVASTYGYPYPAVPDGAGPAVPETAPFVGGLARVDVDPDEQGCHTVWNNDIASAAVPKLSLASRLLYTTARSTPGSLDLASRYDFVAIDADDGSLSGRKTLGATAFRNTLQLAGNADPSGNYWQGTMGGLFRISAAEECPIAASSPK